MNIIQHLNWFDFVIMAIIILSIVISFFRGFLREIISLTTWIVGIVVALKFAAPFSDMIQPYIPPNTLRYIIAFILLFVAVFILGFIINVIVKRLVEATGLTITDRLIGLVFGSARGVLAVAILLMLINTSTAPDTKVPEWAKASQLAPEFVPLVTWLDGFLPDQLGVVSKWIGKEFK